ncbi:putative FCP1 domain, HAD superfamily protein [Helianthus debilis subsp. tardiflorus]
MATEESITKNIVAGYDHIPVTKTEDSGIKITTIFASEENHVETEAANNNVVVGSDTRHTNEKEDKEDGVASEDEDNKKQTGSDLSISMDKLNLGLKKKLIVLPITGFLVHRAFRFRQNTLPKNRQPDFCSGSFMIYKRPFCDEFLKFCFERFEVGIWSSAMELVSQFEFFFIYLLLLSHI